MSEQRIMLKHLCEKKGAYARRCPSCEAPAGMFCIWDGRVKRWAMHPARATRAGR